MTSQYIGIQPTLRVTSCRKDGLGSWGRSWGYMYSTHARSKLCLVYPLFCSMRVSEFENQIFKVLNTGAQNSEGTSEFIWWYSCPPKSVSYLETVSYLSLSGHHQATVHLWTEWRKLRGSKYYPPTPIISLPSDLVCPSGSIDLYPGAPSVLAQGHSFFFFLMYTWHITLY